MLSIQHLRVEFGPRVIFADLSFVIHPKERIAFAGHNGAGKSTLMKCLAGKIEPNSGEIIKPRDCRVGYLPQEGIHISGISLWNETEKAFAAAVTLQRRIEQLSSQLSSHDPRSTPYSQILEEIGELELRLDSFDTAKIKPRIEGVLTGLGFSRKDFERDCGEFSGGWQMRIALAKLLLQEPDVLLLDEPTNHLDIDSQSWVEQYLNQYPGAIAIISHDTALLDSLTRRTIAFHQGKAEDYAGNYSFYLRESKARKEILRRQYKAQQKEIEKTEQFINRFRSKATKAAQVQSRIKQLEKMERIVIEEDDAMVHFKFPPPPPSGQSVVKLERISKSYGDLKLFSEFNLEINRGDRIAIIGPNGAGKSTLCRLITGEESPDSGAHQLGHKVQLSFFSQNHADDLPTDQTIEESVTSVASRENAPYVRNLLGCFLFRGDDVLKQIGVLSGGERSRVALTRMLVRPANFLILDEPTNHLDVQSQEVLQGALSDYPGTFLIVSHNRAFLDPIVTKTIEIRSQAPPRVFQGNISYYLDKKAEEETTNAKLNSPRNGGTTSPKPTPTNRREARRVEAEKRQQRSQLLSPLQQELQRVEQRIAELEAAQATLSEHMSQPDVAQDGEKMQQASIALANTSNKLENAFSAWAELSDKIERLQQELA